MKFSFVTPLAVFLILFLGVQFCKADTISDLFAEPQQKNGEVVVERPIDLTANYKDRRHRHGVLFSVAKEKFYPVDYQSQYKDQFIDQLIGGRTISLLSAELGYKYNFSLGSIGLLIGYAQGNSDAPGLNNIWIKRTTASASIALDNYFDEPYVVPYFQGGVSNFAVEEGRSGTGYQNSSASAVPNYKMGILFQLNWIEKAIDPTSEGQGLRSSGLENTYLDVYYIAHFPTSASITSENPNEGTEPNMRTQNEMGIGLKMEF